LREALAGTGHDFLLRDNKRAGEKRNAKRRGDKSGFFRLPGFRSRPKARTLIIIAFAALAIIGVPLNALYFQDGRHPAPLFGASAPPPAPLTTERATPLPPPRPTAPAVSPSEPPARTDAAKTENANLAERLRDPIGLLLASRAPKGEQSDKKTLFAQRALLKLGYVVRPDGKFGAATRKTLEKFEHDSGLPVKGELTPKILRRLSARSGLALE
jgi:hypothetical protein